MSSAGESGGEAQLGLFDRAVARPPGTLVFDLETQRSADDVGGWGQIAKMGLALAVTEELESGTVRVWREADALALIAELRTARRVIGYNVKRFDYQVLSAYSPTDFALIPTLDLLEELKRALGFRVKLDDVAKETLGTAKSGDGMQSLRWWKEGRVDLIEAYCKQDVVVTRDVYRFGKEHGHVCYRSLKSGTRATVQVEW